MRMPLLIAALLIPATASSMLASDSDSELSISRLGNTLIVTAPAAADGDDAHLSAILSQHVSVDFKDASLDQVASFLRQVTNENLVLAPAVISSATTITFKADGMTLGNALHWICTLANIHYGYVNGALYLSDHPVAAASVTRMYDVTDLLFPLRDFPGPKLGFTSDSGKEGGVKMAMAADQPDNTQTADDLVDLIKKTIRPGDWSQ